MKKIISTIITLCTVMSLTLTSFANQSNTSKSYIYKMDIDYNWSIDSSIQINDNISKQEKVQAIIDSVEKTNFQNLQIDLLKIENDIVYIDLKESQNSNTTWQQIMSGSLGGFITSQEVICNMLQPNYYEDFIKGIYISYEGNDDKEQVGFDHAGADFFGSILTKDDIETLDNKPISIFNDTKDHWARQVIEKFYGKNYINGYSDSTFRPNDSITRAEFVSIVNSYFGLTKTSGKVFEDTKDHWAKIAIDIAVTNGVCSGKTATEFKPNDHITREEACVMMASYKNVADRNYDKLSKYKDAYKVSTWAKPGVEGSIEQDYMSGYSDNTFRPKDKITRAEAVVTLSRIKI